MCVIAGRREDSIDEAISRDDAVVHNTGICKMHRHVSKCLAKEVCQRPFIFGEEGLNTK